VDAQDESEPKPRRQIEIIKRETVSTGGRTFTRAGSRMTSVAAETFSDFQSSPPHVVPREAWWGQPERRGEREKSVHL